MKISGSLSQLLEGLDRCKIPIESLVGLPINDSNGNAIGFINAVDIDNNIWHGEVKCFMNDINDIPASVIQSGIPLNAIRERFGFEPIK